MRTQLAWVLNQLRKKLREGRKEFTVAHRERGTHRKTAPGERAGRGLVSSSICIMDACLCSAVLNHPRTPGMSLTQALPI